MDFFGIFGKDFVVGLDMGSSSVKMVQWSMKERRVIHTEIQEFGTQEGSEGSESSIVAALEKAVQNIDISRSEFIVACNALEMGLRMMTLPMMPDHEMIEAVRLKAKDFFPFSIQDSLISIERYGEVAEDGVRKQRVVVAVAPRQKIEEMLGLLSKAGIRPVGIIPVSYGLLKWVEAQSPEEGRAACFINMGSRFTELAIFEGSSLVFSRKIPVAGLDFSKAMTGVLTTERGKTELTFNMAEKIKREIGYPSGSETAVVADNNISTAQISSLLRSPLEQFVSEIERCVHYYHQESNGRPIHSMTLFGGGASLKGLSQALSEDLGVPVTLGDSFEILGLKNNPFSELPSDRSRFEIAIGGVLAPPWGINMLPWKMKSKEHTIAKKVLLESLTVVAVLFFAFIYIGARIQLANVNKRMRVAERQLASFDLSLDNMKDQILANNVLAGEPYWEDVLKEISHLIPSNAYLTELSYKDQKVAMKGVIQSPERELILPKFVQALEKGLFKSARLVRMKDGENKLSGTFEVEAVLGDKGA